jgi:proteic killer suppression protein
MIFSFADQTTEDVFNGLQSKAARKFPVQLHRAAQRRLDYLNRAETLEDMKSPPGNRLHTLSGERSGDWSLSINDQWRITFKWSETEGPSEVKIEDYH